MSAGVIVIIMSGKGSEGSGLSVTTWSLARSGGSLPPSQVSVLWWVRILTLGPCCHLVVCDLEQFIQLLCLSVLIWKMRAHNSTYLSMFSSGIQLWLSISPSLWSGGAQQNSFHWHTKEPPRKKAERDELKEEESGWQLWLSWSPREYGESRKNSCPVECFPFIRFFALILAFSPSLSLSLKL